MDLIHYHFDSRSSLQADPPSTPSTLAPGQTDQESRSVVVPLHAHLGSHVPPALLASTHASHPSTYHQPLLTSHLFSGISRALSMGVLTQFIT